MMDVDHFKKFNDHYGHQGGDDCLRAVAVQARDQMRGNDLFARYGGEEFAVIVRNAWVDEAVHVAERMRAAVSGMGLPHHGVGPDAIVSISVGVASAVPDSVAGMAQLIEAADAALYNAKRGGRNRVCASATDPQPPEPGYISTAAHSVHPLRAAQEDLALSGSDVAE
jgi:diguanylate cyclase (GGDEF)-like protein